MKKILLVSIALCLAFTGNAQTVTQDFESGNRGQQGALCWEFPGTSFKSGSNAITDKWGGRTGALSSTTNKMGVWSPWMDMEKGDITFLHKLNGNFNGSSKKMEVIIQSYDDNSEKTLYTFDYDKDNATKTQKASVPVSVTGIYKIKIVFSGDGGSNRGLIDDISIPGTNVSDPSTKCLPKIKFVDSDGDGIADIDDDFPKDKHKALKTYLTSNDFGTLLCEDLWPSKGDYDYNDLVFDYRISMITNASKEVVEFTFEIVTRAIGGSYKNGFACEIMGLSPNQIIKIKGNKTNGSLFKTDANGTEAGQKYANIPFFDDAFKVLNYPGGIGGINTNPASPAAKYDSMTISVILMEDGVAAAGGILTTKGFEDIEFNPYLVVNQERSKEIHLVDMPPTTLASTKYFGEQDDASNPGKGKYYRSKSNVPWMIAVSKSIPYPTEKAEFSTAFTKFIEWAESGGELSPDWYLNLKGYRNEKNLYLK